MSASARRKLALLLAGLSVVALALPADALAHGIVGKADLPIPVWLFSWTAAIVLVVSFVALSTLWMRPQLQEPHLRRLFTLPRMLEWLGSLVGVGLFALVLYSGFAGAQVAQANFSVTFIYVIFWVGLPVLSVLLAMSFVRSAHGGRVRACSRRSSACPGAGSGQGAAALPGVAGAWPATAGVVGFAWLELIYIEKDNPSTLAALSLGYFLAMLVGMALFGVEDWSTQADGFGVYFNLLSARGARAPRGRCDLPAPSAERRD